MFPKELSEGQKVKTYAVSKIDFFLPGRGVGCSGGAPNAYSGKLISTGRGVGCGGGALNAYSGKLMSTKRF